MRTPKTRTTSRTLKRYDRRSSVTHHTEFDIVKISFVSVAIAALSNFSMYFFVSLVQWRKRDNPSGEPRR
jgi:hypothetical protein